MVGAGDRLYLYSGVGVFRAKLGGYDDVECDLRSLRKEHTEPRRRYERAGIAIQYAYRPDDEGHSR